MCAFFAFFSLCVFVCVCGCVCDAYAITADNNLLHPSVLSLIDGLIDFGFLFAPGQL